MYCAVFLELRYDDGVRGGAFIIDQDLTQVVRTVNPGAIDERTRVI